MPLGMLLEQLPILKLKVGRGSGAGACVVGGRVRWTADPEDLLDAFHLTLKLGVSGVCGRRRVDVGEMLRQGEGCDDVFV